MNFNLHYIFNKQIVMSSLTELFRRGKGSASFYNKKVRSQANERGNEMTRPTLSTIERYANAAGYRLEINFVPETHS